MRRDMRLMQRRRVNDDADALHRARDRGAVGDRGDLVGERPRNDVEPDSGAARRAKRAHQGFAHVPRTAGDELGSSKSPWSQIRLAFKARIGAHQRGRAQLAARPEALRRLFLSLCHCVSVQLFFSVANSPWRLGEVRNRKGKENCSVERNHRFHILL